MHIRPEIRETTKILMSIAKVSFQTTMSKSGLQSFFLAIGRWEMNTDLYGGVLVV